MCKRGFLRFNLWAYVIMILVTLGGSIWVSNSALTTASIHVLMISFILLSGFWLFGRKTDLKYDEEDILTFIIFVGCTMRIGYTLYNGVFSRVHDTWYYDDYTANSKSTYLMWILERGKLPDSYEGQLYHQPFSYIMSALCCKLIQPFVTNNDIYYLGGIGGKLSSCMASCAVLFMIPRLGLEVSMKKRNILFFTWLVAVFPGFFLIAGRIGEDAFSCFFAMAEILYTIKWHKEPYIKNTVLLALFYGLGLQTNLSCVLPAFFTVYVVLEKMLRNRCEFMRYIKETVLFCVISVPLGLWFYIRNYIKFGIPFTYVNEQIIGGVLWTGNVPLWKRYWPLDIKNFVESPYAFPYDDYNLPAYFLKSELFGEYTFEISNIVPYVMLIINILITIFAIVCMIKILFRKNAPTIGKLLSGLLILYCLFEMFSYYKEPFGCTMDARYFLIITILKLMFFAWSIKEKEIEKVSPITIFMTKGIYIGVLLFGACSIAMFCVIE